MKLLKQESHRLFIKRYFLIALILLIFSDIMFTYISVNSANPLSSGSFAIFKSYMQKYEGKITTAKIIEIDELIEYKDNIITSKEATDTKYKSGSITDKEYEKYSKEYNKCLSEIEGFNRFLSIYYDSLSRNTDIVDVSAWSILLSGKEIDIFTVTAVILMVILLCVNDRERGMDYIKSTTKAGKNRLCRIQIFLVISISLFIAIVVPLIKFIIADMFYGLSCFGSGVRCMEDYIIDNNISLLSAYLIESVFKLIGTVYLGILTYSLGIILNSSLYTAFFGFVLTYIPAYLFADRRILNFLPFPSSMLSGYSLYHSWIVNDVLNIYFELTLTKALIYVVLIIALSVALVIYTNRFRKRRIVI